MVGTFDKEQAAFLRLLGYLLLEYGHAKRARTLYQGILVDTPDDSGVKLGLGKACLELEEYEVALEMAEAYITSSEADAHLGHYLKSRALWGMGLGDQAKDAMGQYIAARGK